MLKELDKTLIFDRLFHIRLKNIYDLKRDATRTNVFLSLKKRLQKDKAYRDATKAA